VNAVAVKQTIDVFLCPSQPDAEAMNGQWGNNHYAGNAGTVPGANDGLLFPRSRVLVRDLTDGRSNTIAAGEIAFEFGGWDRGAINTGGGGEGFARGVMRWWQAAAPCNTKPGMNPPASTCQSSAERRFQFAGAHSGGVQYAIGDGQARFIGENVDANLFRALLTRNGGESVGKY
jgi:hypothetical protein